MSKNRQQMKQDFAMTADRLIREVSTGEWDQRMAHWRDLPIEEWEAVLEEFASRCPGHERPDYVEALRRSHWNNR